MPALSVLGWEQPMKMWTLCTNTASSSVRAAIMNYMTWMAIKFSQFWRLESKGSRCWQIWYLMGTHFPVHRWPSSAVSSHGVEEVSQLSRVSLIRALILFMKAPPLLPNCFFKALPLCSIILVIRFQHRNFRSAPTFSDGFQISTTVALDQCHCIVGGLWGTFSWPPGIL